MKHLILALICIGIMASSMAQEQSPSKLSFEEAVKIGLEKNMLLNQQKNLLITSQAQKVNAVGNLLPSLNVGGNYQHQKGQQANTTTGDLEDLVTDYAGLQLNVNYTIFNGLGRLNNLLSADKAVMAQGYFVKRTSQDVVYNVALQYLQVLLDQELLKIAVENYNAQKALLDKIQATYDVGAKAITDVRAQDAIVKGMDLTAIRARNTLQNDKSILSQTLQLDPSQPYEAIYPTFKDEFTDYSKVSLDSLIKIALENRADLKQLTYQAESYKYTLRSVSGRYLPSLSAYANYGSFYYSLIEGSVANQFRVQNPSTTIGLNLTIPIFSSFQTRAQRVAAKVTYENSVLAKENSEKTVKLDVQRAYNNYVNAIEGYHAGLSQFQAGELSLQTQQESYLLGVTDQAALAVATQTYVSGAAAKAQAEVTLLFQKIMLDYSLGTLTVEDSQ